MFKKVGLINNLGTKIRSIRRSKGINQKDLAKKLKIHQPTVSQIEAGKRKVGVVELGQICEVLKIEIKEFFKKRNGGFK